MKFSGSSCNFTLGPPPTRWQDPHSFLVVSVQLSVSHLGSYEPESPVVLCVYDALDGSVALSATCSPCQVCVSG